MASRAGKIDGIVDGVQGPLGEWREGPDLLDLVAEELDAQRLAARAREDVDEPTADRNLPALLDSLDALVAGVGQCLDEVVEARTVLTREPDELRAIIRGRHAFRERASGDADHAAACEDVERAGTLADEVGRRLESGAGTHATAREEGHARGIGVPADSLGDVTCLLVLGEEADERALERTMQRREEKRERRLRNAGVRREGVDERAEALIRGERVDETGERRCRWVHAAGGNRVPRRDGTAANADETPPRVARGAGPTNAPRGTPVSLRSR